MLTRCGSQCHIDPAYNATVATQTLAQTKSPFWGVAFFEATSLDKIFEVFQDEEFLRIAGPDAAEFFDPEKAQMLAGPIAPIIDK